MGEFSSGGVWACAAEHVMVSVCELCPSSWLVKEGWRGRVGTGRLPGPLGVDG